MAELGARWRALPPELQRLGLTVAGLGLGVPLLLCGWWPAQGLGVVAVAAGLGAARAGERLPAAWLAAPHRGLPEWPVGVSAGRRVRVRPLVVGVGLLLGVAYLGDRLLVRHAPSTASLWPLAEGLLGLAMIGPLALWWRRPAGSENEPDTNR